MNEHRATPNFLTLSEHLYEALRRRIIDGTLAVSAPLSQIDLAAEYGVSRTPLREALARLDKEGLVEFRPRRGYVVASLDVEQVQEVCELRALIEERSSYSATRHRTDDDVNRLKTILVELDKLTANSSHESGEWARANRKLHMHFILASRRDIYRRVGKLIYDTIERYVWMEGSINPRVEEASIRAQAEHHEIFEAYRRGDAEKVARLAREHCDHTRDRLLASLRNTKKQVPPSHRDGGPATDETVAKIGELERGDEPGTGLKADG